MEYNFTLPTAPKQKKPAWKEREHPAVIISFSNTQRILGIHASFIENCRTTLPDAVYYHSRVGKYQVFGLVNYDNCSGIMAFYGKAWGARPEEMSKTVPHGAGAVSLSYMPNETAVLILHNGCLYKVDRYTAAVKMAVPLEAKAVFAGRNIYTVEGRFVKEYSPKGRLMKIINPALPWSATINSGAVDHLAGTVFVCNEEGRLAREDDTNPSLSARANYANNLNADWFLSLHTNAGGGTGFESFVYNNAPASTRALRTVLHDQVARYYTGSGLPDRGQKQANFAVLRETQMPAVLLENLFIDNARDAAYLKDQSFLEGAASAIAGGVVRAFGLEAVQSWDPAAEIALLRERGIINGDHNPADQVNWGEFATVLNRLMEKYIL